MAQLSAQMQAALYYMRKRRLSRLSGGEPPPVVELGIASIDASGNFATLTTAPTVAVLNSPFAVRRNGYVMNAGDTAPTLQNWTEEVYLTKRRIIPAGSEAAGYSPAGVGTEVMLSRVVMQGDALVNQPGATINSTRAPPAVHVRWISPGFRVIGDVGSASATCWSFYTRNGTPVAAMAFVWRDSFGNAVRAYARVPTAYTGFGVTGYSAHQYAVSGVDLSSLDTSASQRITLDWEVYGHFGQLITSNDAAFNTLNTTRWFHGRQYFRKNAAMASNPVVAYINPGFPGPTPQCDRLSNAANARLNCFTSFQAARDAADDFNNAQFTLGGPALDGVIFRFMDGAGNVIAKPSLSSASICNIAGFIVEPDPLSAFSPRPVMQGFTSQLSTTQNPNSMIGYTIRGFDYARNADTTTFLNPGAGVASNPIPNVVNLRMYLEAPAGGGNFDLNTGALSSLFGSAYGHCYGFTFQNNSGSTPFAWVTTNGLGGLYDCVISDYGNKNLSSFCLVAVRALNVASVGIQGSANGTVEQFGDAVRIEQTPTNNTAIIGSGDSADKGAGWRNSQLIILNGTEGNKLSLSSDNTNSTTNIHSLPNFGFHHCDIPGICPAIRGNVFYVDGPFGGGRSHPYSGFTNSVLPKLACKGDWFGVSNVADAAREPGYREFAYGVGNKGNFHTGQFALSEPGFEIEAPRHYGMNSLPGPLATGGVRKNGPFANPGWLDARIPTTEGSNGSVGGDYRHSTAMPTPSSADVLFDMLGLPVPLACVRPGANSGYGL